MARFKIHHATDALTGAPMPETFEGEDKGHWWEMECKRCGWAIVLPKDGQAAAATIADRYAQMREHLRETHRP